VARMTNPRHLNLLAFGRAAAIASRNNAGPKKTAYNKEADKRTKDVIVEKSFHFAQRRGVHTCNVEEAVTGNDRGYGS
jgi:hypothetical protein